MCAAVVSQELMMVDEQDVAFLQGNLHGKS